MKNDLASTSRLSLLALNKLNANSRMYFESGLKVGILNLQYKIDCLVRNNEIVVLTHQDVDKALCANKAQILSEVKKAYESYYNGDGHSEKSSFLRFPSDPGSRIIALPSRVDAEGGLAGIKWIASFPRNLEKNIDRASAIQILNDRNTGRPFAIIEASIISARRTAASAALAASYIQKKNRPVKHVGVVGCGLLSFESLRYLTEVFGGQLNVKISDTNYDYQKRYKKVLQKRFSFETVALSSVEEIAAECDITIFATNAIEPHVSELIDFKPGSTILNISLRDLKPKHMISAVNICDDTEKAFSENTSLGLARDAYGNHNVTAYDLNSVFKGELDSKLNSEATRIFSPFGLGILDLKLSEYVFRVSENPGNIKDFFCKSWLEREML